MATLGRAHDFVLEGIGEPGGPFQRHDDKCWCRELADLRQQVETARANPVEPSESEAE